MHVTKLEDDAGSGRNEQIGRATLVGEMEKGLPRRRDHYNRCAAPVGPNFSHHKARVQAVGWFPLGTRK